MCEDFAGLELRMRVLATAEVLAIPYYTALRDATGSPLLRSICSRILAEEAEHLRFQAFTFARLGSRRQAVSEKNRARRASGLPDGRPRYWFGWSIAGCSVPEDIRCASCGDRALPWGKLCSGEYTAG